MNVKLRGPGLREAPLLLLDLLSMFNRRDDCGYGVSGRVNSGSGIAGGVHCGLEAGRVKGSECKKFGIARSKLSGGSVLDFNRPEGR